jgi:hypothetical protein
MKRLNTKTNLPFICGNIREDGFYFIQYKTKKPLKKDGTFQEAWVTKEVFEKTRKTKQKHSLIWIKNNPSKDLARVVKRRTLKLKRTPLWLTKEHFNEILKVYELAKTLQKKYNVPYHVDHIVPLQGKTVSGLHVPWNLRAIPAKENLVKSNKTEGIF